MVCTEQKWNTGRGQYARHRYSFITDGQVKFPPEVTSSVYAADMSIVIVSLVITIKLIPVMIAILLSLVHCTLGGSGGSSFTLLPLPLNVSW